jgi:hypothetical protein
MTIKIVALILALLWIVPYTIAGIRRLINGPFVPEPIDESFLVKYEAQAAKEGWFHRFWVVFDIFINVCFRGQEDETISSRAWRASLQGKLWGRLLNYWLDLWQPQHGPKACIGDLWRAQTRIQTNRKALGLNLPI